MKILLMHETVTLHDAVSNDIGKMADILSEQNEVYVFAITRKNPRLHYIDEAGALELVRDTDNLLIYHHSVYWEKGYEILKETSCRILFRYHNITPANYFYGYSKPHYDVCKLGREMTDSLQKEFPNAFWMCDSRFNARDLCFVGKERILIVPPFHKIEEWGKAQPDRAAAEELKKKDSVNVLFVGRIVPNKGILFLIDVINYYCHAYGRNIKLRIVGKAEEALNPYTNRVKRKIEDYQLADQIELIGEVTDETLAAYYRGSDVFLCCSFHEGFCVPIIEAQYFGLPVLALRYSAVPEAAGPEQLMFSYAPSEFAAAIKTVADNRAYREYLARKGRLNYDGRFSYGSIRQSFEESLKTVMEAPTAACCHSKEEKLRIAFVAPWYGEKIPGGAEMELRELSGHLLKKGIEAEVLTTQVRQFGSDWNVNYYPEGTEFIGPLPVTRFPVRKRDNELFDRINGKLMNGETLSAEEESVFCREMINSPALYRHIRKNRDLFDCFIFIPYMFGTTYYGIRECYDKAVMIPCLHEEGYAYLERFKKSFSRVAGMIFNAYPEMRLAEKIYDLKNVRKEVLGIGIETDTDPVPQRFREKFGIREDFILYAGRKDSGKGVDRLMDHFCQYKKKHKDSLKMVLIGGGSVEIPSAFQQDILDLGFVSREDKFDAYSAALCLCQLSAHESFSLVIMESWLCGRPVIVNSECAVTADFVRRFNGGFSIHSYQEFEAGVEELLSDPSRAAALGNNGRKSVLENFDWDVVSERYIRYLTELKAEDRKASVDVEEYMETFQEMGS